MTQETAAGIAAWQNGHARVRELVSGLDAEQLETHMPACPDWTVRDLLSHVVGLGADVAGGDEPDDHNERWTRAQVESRRDRGVDELLDEWSAVAPALVASMAENGPRPLNDLLIHEQDLRSAAGVPGARDTDGLRFVRQRMAGRLAEGTSDLPPLALVSTDDGWSWATRGEPDDAEVVLEAPGFDLFRGLTSRRTADQLRGWVTRGDVEPYLDAFARLGPLPTEPLPE